MSDNVKYKLLSDQAFYRLRHKETGLFFHPQRSKSKNGKLYSGRKPSLSYAGGIGRNNKMHEWEVVTYMLIEVLE